MPFSSELGIKPEDWPSVTLNDLQARLHAYLRSIRNDVMLAALDVFYVKTISLITLAADGHEVNSRLDAMVRRAKQSMQNH
jgi:hypothetical protein